MQRISPRLPGKTGPSLSRAVLSHAPKLVLIPLLSALAATCAARTRLGSGLNELSYSLTQHRLARTGAGEALAVAVIDVSGLPRQPGADAAAPHPGCYRFRDCVTDRDSLLALIKAVTQQSPRAIGIDIDFSPQDGWIDPVRDPWFLGELRALQTSQAIPIHVVAGRGSAAGRADWLGTAEFASLAASATRSPTDLRAPFTLWHTSPATGDALCSMPALLTGQCSPGRTRSGGLFPTSRRFEHCTRDHVCLRGAEFYVDYSRLDEITSQTYSAWRPEQVLARNLRDKIVLLGYAAADAPIDDRVSVPGRHNDVPGVFALAAATQTLADGKLRVPGEITGVVMDIAFALVVLLAIQLSERGLRARNAELRVNRKRMNTVQQLIWPLLFGVLGFIFVAQTRIIWSDFLVTVPILMLFLWLEPRLGGIWRALRAAAGRTFLERANQARDKAASA
jgi:CHASE2 domain-containing sensor protein